MWLLGLYRKAFRCLHYAFSRNLDSHIFQCCFHCYCRECLMYPHMYCLLLKKCFKGINSLFSHFNDFVCNHNWIVSFISFYSKYLLLVFKEYLIIYKIKFNKFFPLRISFFTNLSYISFVYIIGWYINTPV